MSLQILSQEPPKIGEAVSIAEGVKWMRLPLSSPLRHVNVYAFEEEDGWTLFDAGIDTTETKEAWRQLLAGPLGGRPVQRLIVSHHHPDHMGLAGWFQSQGTRLLTTRTAWLYARMLWLDEQIEPAPEALAYWRFAGMSAAEITAKAQSRPFNFHDVLSPMPLGFERIREGTQLQIGGRDFVARLGQGHAPDQLTLWQIDGPLVLIADQCLPTISPNIGVYPTEIAANPLTEFLASCRSLAELGQDHHLALPGHGRPFHGIAARAEALIEEHEQGLSRLRAYIRTQSATVVECFTALYRRDIRPSEQGLALAETLAHLNHLSEMGQAKRTVKDGVAYWRGVES